MGQSIVRPDGLDLFYKAVSLTKAKQVLVSGSTLSSIMTTKRGGALASHFSHAELDCLPEIKYEEVVSSW